jgi:hypothetical protein
MAKLLLLFVLIVFFSNSAIAGGSVTVKWGEDTAPEKQTVKKKAQKRFDDNPDRRIKNDV